MSRSPTLERRRGFTLVELLVVISVIAVLTALAAGAFSKVRSHAQGASCAHSLRQLGAATQMYLAENEQRLFPYSQIVPGVGRLWYFGLEAAGSLGATEGDRQVDGTKAPIYPYLQHVGGVEVCPSFPYDTALAKPKYKKASWGYGYNTLLSNVNVLTLERPSQIIVFGDCAQVNTFQAPASSKNPLIEEFYIINHTERTVHFRHGTRANMLFLDGHVDAMKMYPGTQDTRIREANIGRITAMGSMEFLR